MPRLYDLYGHDWPGEWNFYRQLAADPSSSPTAY
jgi:hypothetical protein